ncbi:MAG TPA: electron transfer flavoprotein subunit alpha/FixB family protein [Acidimicrobiia bacterium]|nr:electron transfer flavoprotein subunit alpha/FixB family protein [Acidimicrobiia bacterium]
MILVLLTHDRGAIEETTWQALTFARRLVMDIGSDLHAVWIGDDLDAEGLGERGVSVVHHVTHDGLDDYAPQAWGASLAQLVTRLGPEAVVAIGSGRGNEVLAHVGALLDVPMVANVREATTGDGAWSLVRTRWGGSLLEETNLEAEVKLMTLAEHVIEAAGAVTSGDVTVERFAPELEETELVTKIVDRVTTAEGITLATAPVVVSGGRGVGSAEGFGPLEELADLLSGVVGCSRVVTNNGWRPHSDQVGQTGTVVAPDLYIACGISGAIQHWVGMMASGTILAINTDPEAPMVTKADYAVLGDLKEIVPAIVEEVKRRNG